MTTRDTRDEQLSDEEWADEECPFCDYAGPSPIVKEYADSYVIEPLNPVTEGHVLVIPKRHVASFGTEQWRAVEAAMSGAWLYVRDARLPAFNIITSAGREATQTVEHLHVHVVPRREDDELLLPWSPDGLQDNAGGRGPDAGKPRALQKGGRHDPSGEAAQGATDELAL